MDLVAFAWVALVEKVDKCRFVVVGNFCGVDIPDHGGVSTEPIFVLFTVGGADGDETFGKVRDADHPILLWSDAGIGDFPFVVDVLKSCVKAHGVIVLSSCS